MKGSAESYAQIAASFPWHDKILAVPAEDRAAAFGIYCAAVCFCQRELTDGKIRRQDLARVFPSPEIERLSAVLCAEKLFDSLKDSYRVHDYLKHNRSRKEVEEIREKRRSAGKVGGLAKALAKPKQNASKRLAKVYPDTDTDTDTEIDQNQRPYGRGTSQGTEDPTTAYFAFEDKRGKPPTSDQRASISRLVRVYGLAETKIALGYAFDAGASNILGYACDMLKKGAAS